MYLLDTNIISQRPKLRPNPAVMAWMSSISFSDLRISAISIQEIRLGIELLMQSRKRTEIEMWLEQDVLVNFADKILAVDAAVAEKCGRIIAIAKRKHHHTASLSDALIAATAMVHGLRVATLNRQHFEPLGVDLVKL